MDLYDNSQLKLLKKGKVRDIYDIGHDSLLIRHSDRVSSFDKVWCDIKGKGMILNNTSVWWFNKTKHIMPNHLIYSKLDSTDMIVNNCEVFPIEFVVRGYITGNTQTSLWTHYNNGEREYCGIKFPDGLIKNQELSKPVITPTIKADVDIPISPIDIVERGYMTEQDWLFCSSKALELFKYGQKLANELGLILVDTKYEFGRDNKTKQILLIDEIHTCDSSRYWKLDTYIPRYISNIEPERFDKDLVRTYIKSQCNPYETEPSDITIPQDIKDTVSSVYADFYNILTAS